MTLDREARWLVERPRFPLARLPRECSIEIVVAVSTLLAVFGAVAPAPVVRTFLAFFGLAGLCMAWVLELARREDREMVRYKEVRGEFEGDYGALVSLLIRQGDAPTGEDVGALWFEDGRLYFAGRRTSFGLVPGQARSVGPVRERIRGLRNEVELILRRDTAAGPMVLSFAPLLPPHESRFVHRKALRTDLTSWIDGWAEGSGQFPPAARGPGVMGDRRLLLETLAIVLPLPVALALFVETVRPAFAGFGSAFGLFVMFAIVPAGNLRLRALRDRRRLEKAQWKT